MWKYVECFKVYEKADCHKEATNQTLFANNPTIVKKLSAQAAKPEAENRCMLLKPISSLNFLLRPGLAFRGHKETEKNLVQLLFLRGEDDLPFKR